MTRTVGMRRGSTHTRMMTRVVKAHTHEGRIIKQAKICHCLQCGGSHITQGGNIDNNNLVGRRKIKNCKRHLDLVRWKQSFKRFHLSQSRLINQRNHRPKKAKRIKRKSMMSHQRKRRKPTKSLMRVTNLLKMIMEIPQRRQKKPQKRNKLKEQTSHP